MSLGGIAIGVMVDAAIATEVTKSGVPAIGILYAEVFLTFAGLFLMSL